MAKRPLTPNGPFWLLDEIKYWESQRLLTEEQGDRILDLYETPTDRAVRHGSTMSFVLMGVAALCVGLSVFLMVAWNWDDLSKAVKLGLIFTTLVGSYGLGFWLRYVQRAKMGSEIAFFLSSLFYGAAIWLVAQTLNLNSHYPDGFWWWAVGILPFALALDTILIHVLLVAVLSAWVGTEVLGFSDLGLWFFGRWQALPNSALTLPIFAGLGIAWSYRKGSPGTLALYVPLLAWWMLLQPFAFAHRIDDVPIFFFVSLGAAMLVIAEAHRPGSPFAIPFRLWGTILALGALMPLSFIDAHGVFLPRNDLLASAYVQTVPIGVLVALVLAVWLWLRDDRSDLSKPWTTFVAQEWFPMGLLALMAFMSVWHVAFASTGGAPLVPTILANVAMLAASYWLVSLGLAEDRGRPFTFGVLYFLLWTVLRYFDLFGGDMLGAAFLFLLCGATLFGIAWYWQHRRRNQPRRTLPAAPLDDVIDTDITELPRSR